MFQLFAKAEDSQPLIRPRKPLTFLNPNKEHSPVVLVDLSREPALIRQRILKFANETFNEHSPLVISPYLSKSLKHKLLRPKFEECLAEELVVENVKFEKDEENRKKVRGRNDDVQIIDAKLAAKSAISTRMQKIRMLWNTCARTRPFVGKHRTNSKTQTNNGFRKLTPEGQYLKDLHCKVAEEKCVSRLLHDMVLAVSREFPVESKPPVQVTPPAPPAKYIRYLRCIHIKQFLTNVSKCLEFLSRNPVRVYEIRDNDAKIMRIIYKVINFLNRLDPRIRLPDVLMSALYHMFVTVCMRIGKPLPWPLCSQVYYVLHAYCELPELFTLISRSQIMELSVRMESMKARSKPFRNYSDLLLHSDETSFYPETDRTLLPYIPEEEYGEIIVVDETDDPEDLYFDNNGNQLSYNYQSHSEPLTNVVVYNDPIPVNRSAVRTARSKQLVCSPCIDDHEVFNHQIWQPYNDSLTQGLAMLSRRRRL